MGIGLTHLVRVLRVSKKSFLFSRQGDKGLTTSILEAECSWSSGFFHTVGMHSLSVCASSTASLPSNTLASSGVEIFFIFLSEKLGVFSWNWGGEGSTSPGGPKWGKRSGDLIPNSFKPVIFYFIHPLHLFQGTPACWRNCNINHTAILSIPLTSTHKPIYPYDTQLSFLRTKWITPCC